jgi:hypothetical protein
MSKGFFSKILVLSLVLLFVSSASAIVTVSVPVEASVSNKGTVEFGAASPGETVSIVIQRNSRQGFLWDSVAVNAPANWALGTRTSDKTIIVDLTIPKGAPESIQVINFSLSSLEPKVPPTESFTGTIAVKKNLVTIAIDNLKQEALVGKTISYRLIASNDSIAENKIVVESSLPNYWFQPVEIALLPKQQVEKTIYLTPHAYGLRNFSFFVKSPQTGFSKEFFAELTVIPTLQGKFLASAYALPFFTISNLPYYMLEAVFALPFS